MPVRTCLVIYVLLPVCLHVLFNIIHSCLIFWKHLSLTASVFNIFLYHMFLISSEPMCPYVPELKGVHCLFVCSQMDVGQGWGHWTGMINWPGGGINSSR